MGHVGQCGMREIAVDTRALWDDGMTTTWHYDG